MIEFDERYFRQRDLLEDSGHLAEVAKRVQEFFPGSVLDIGCGVGWVVKHLVDGGVDAVGIDVSEYGYGSRVIDEVRLRDFRDEEGEYSTVLASGLLQCLTDVEVGEFAHWSLGHVRHHLLILNTPGDGDEHTRSTSHYKGVFTEAGWVTDNVLHRELKAATGWDCLVLARKVVQSLRSSPLSKLHLKTSLVVDCWSSEYLRELFDHVRGLMLFDAELVLVNTDRCSGVRKYLTPRGGERAGFAEWSLSETQIPVVLVEGEYRSTAEAFSSGLRVVTGSTVLFMQSVDQISRAFVFRAVQALLKLPEHSFVIPDFFLTCTEYASGRLFELEPSLASLEGFSAAYGCGVDSLCGNLSLRHSAAAQLSDLLDADFVPPVFLARAEDLFSVESRFDPSQPIFAVQDMIFGLAYDGKSGFRDPGLSCLSLCGSERFAPEEVEACREKYRIRSRS